MNTVHEQALSLIFNLPLPRSGLFVRGRSACRRDMARPPLDPLRVPLTELEDESGGRDAQCGACPVRRARVTRPAGRGDLAGFRREFYTSLTARADALFELTDAVLCADGPVQVAGRADAGWPSTAAGTAPCMTR